MSRAALKSPVKGGADLRAFWAQVLGDGSPARGLLVTGSSPDRAARLCGGVLYLAAPHVPLQGNGQLWRNAAAIRQVEIEAELARLAASGVLALCPALVVYGVLAVADLIDGAPAARDLTSWSALAVPTLACARLVAVPALPGWRECPAVAGAVGYALRHNVPVHLYEAAA